MHTTNTANKHQDKAGVVTPYDMDSFDKQITSFYHTNPPKVISKRMLAAVALFLGRPYLWEALGEGPSGKYFQEPLYRTDQFDCVTFVDTVLSLAKSTDLNQFKQNILQIRYAGDEVNYTERTDWFTDLEWLPNAERRGWLKDITEKFVNHNGQPIAKLASTTIDKPNWYKVRPLKELRTIKPLTKETAEQLLTELQAEGHAFQPAQSTLTYLPFTELFDAQNKPNHFFFDQFPSVSVVTVVRPNWQIRDHLDGFPNGYGTNLNVSHLGIAVRTDEDLKFCHASSIEKQVVCLPLVDYLKHYLHSDTIKGIHVEEVL